MGHGGTALVSGGVFVLFVVLVLAIRRPVQRRLSAGTGWAQWQIEARTLPWRDRWTLYVATSFGRAAPVRLTRPAVRRAVVVEAICGRSLARRSIWRWGKIVGILGIVDLALQILALIVDHDGLAQTWRLISPLILVGLGLGLEPLQRAQARLARRSLDLNREQLDA